MSIWAIIYNPASGSFKKDRLEQICLFLESQGITPRLLGTEGPGHATQLAKEARAEPGGVERVIAYGGDGTMNEVLNGLVGGAIPLMFLPGGTGNVMSTVLGISRNPLKALKQMMNHRVVGVFPGIVNSNPVNSNTAGERAFLLMAGFGFDALTVARLTPALKKRLGYAAYIVAGLGTLLRPKPKLMARYGGGTEAGGEVPCHWAVITRTREYGGTFPVHPTANLTADALGFTAVRDPWILPFIALQMGLRLGRWFKLPGTRLAEGLDFTLRGDVPFFAQVDGELLGEASQFSVDVSTAPVQFCFPQS